MGKRSEDFIDERKDEFLSNDIAERMIDGIVEMRQYGIFIDGNHPNGEPIISDIVLDDFLSNCDLECKRELLWAWLQNRTVDDRFLDQMFSAMSITLAKVCGGINRPLVDERLQMYLGIIGCIQPFQRILLSDNAPKLQRGYPKHKARAGMDVDAENEKRGWR